MESGPMMKNVAVGRLLDVEMDLPGGDTWVSMSHESRQTDAYRVRNPFMDTTVQKKQKLLLSDINFGLGNQNEMEMVELMNKKTSSCSFRF